MSTWEDEVRKCEAEAVRAFLAADTTALDRLWADCYAVNSPLQRVLQKKEILGLLSAGNIRHTAYEFEIEHMIRTGDVVIVMGLDHVDGPPANRPLSRRFTNVWKLESGAWRSIARHASPLPPGHVG